MVKPGTEELRQNVFSSTHMSTMAKTTQATITYPCCSYCAGGNSWKSSPKRKVVFGQLSLYTNTSESFIVWYKKHDDPKGMLWLRSCCIKKGHDGAQVELITRGCKERCSYSLSFLALPIADEWYRFLKQESRKAPSIGDGILCEELDSSSSLDSILNEMTPSYREFYSDSDEYWSDDLDRFAQQPAETKVATANPTVSISTVNTLKRKSKAKSTPTIQGIRSTSPILHAVGSPASARESEMLHIVAETATDDQLSRWSWPLGLQT